MESKLQTYIMKMGTNSFDGFFLDFSQHISICDVVFLIILYIISLFYNFTDFYNSFNLIWGGGA